MPKPALKDALTCYQTNRGNEILELGTTPFYWKSPDFHGFIAGI